MNESQCKDFNNMFIKHIFFKNNKKSISKGLLKTRLNFDPSKVHNYHLVKVLNKIISQLILLFHSSRHI
jgi:hypothetical protein